MYQKIPLIVDCLNEEAKQSVVRSLLLSPQNPPPNGYPVLVEALTAVPALDLYKIIPRQVVYEAVRIPIQWTQLDDLYQTDLYVRGEGQHIWIRRNNEVKNRIESRRVGIDGLSHNQNFFRYNPISYPFVKIADRYEFRERFDNFDVSRRRAMTLVSFLQFANSRHVEVDESVIRTIRSPAPRGSPRFKSVDPALDSAICFWHLEPFRNALCQSDESVSRVVYSVPRSAHRLWLTVSIGLTSSLSM